MEYKKNADGTDMLDEQGNLIPADNTNNNNSESTPDEVSALKETLSNVVEELKELRIKNRELTEKPAEETKPAVDDETTKILNVVKQVLSEEKVSKAKTNKQVAFEKFITDNKEFHPDNDITGLKLKALENKIARFNTDGITETEDFYSVFKEANILLGGIDSQTKTSREVQNPYSSTPQTKITPQKNLDGELSPKEKALVDRGSATKEQILKMRETKPAFLAQLLDKVRD